MLRFTQNRTSTLYRFFSITTVRRKQPSQVYYDRVKNGEIRKDPRQELVLKKLDQLYNQLQNYDREKAEATIQAKIAPRAEDTEQSSGWFTSKQPKVASTTNAIVPHPAELPQSVYLYGGVGCGKTMLMDMLFGCVPFKQKQRIHFNAFMVDFHARMHHFRKQQPSMDHVPTVADEIVQKYWLLCFDEFQVTDIADAMILKRLFENLINRGVVVFSTSNRAPNDLYKNGLNREAFLPFIHFLNVKCFIHDMDSQNDYRLTGQRQIGVYYQPLDATTDKKVDDIFKQLTAPYTPEPKNMFILGRMLKVPLQARGVAKFAFNDLCKAALSAVDYIQVAREFHTIILTNVPKLDLEIVGRDVIRRFITLIDELYQHHVKLIITAQAPIEELLFTQGKEENKGNDDVSFAFDRTWSRLNEMQTKQYLESPHSVHNAEHHHLGTSKEVL